MEEQRRDTRVPVRLEVQWGHTTSKCPDVTSDVSLGGCYVESLNPVKVGEVVNLRLSLPSNKTLPFRGEVRYHQPMIGFGVKFLHLSAFERATLKNLLKYWSKRAAAGSQQLAWT